RVAEARFVPNGTMVATRHGGQARLWDVATGQPVGPSFGKRDGTAPRDDERRQGLMAVSPDSRRFAIASDDVAQLWNLPTPMEGEPERLALWTEVVTGMEIDEHRVVHTLDAKTWRERHTHLQNVGGTPLP